MTIVLSPQTERKLREKASREGGDINHVADQIISSTIDWEMQEREETIQALRIADQAAALGKVRPLADVIRDHRAKYGLPESWPFDVEVDPE